MIQPIPAPSFSPEENMWHGNPSLEFPLPPSPRELLIIQFHHSPHFQTPPSLTSMPAKMPSVRPRGCSGSWLTLLCHITRFMPVSPHLWRNSGRLFSHHCIPRAMLIAWHSTDTKYLLHRKPINRWMPDPMEMTKGIEDWWQDYLQSRKPKKVRYSHKRHFPKRFYPVCHERKTKGKDRPNHRVQGKGSLSSNSPARQVRLLLLSLTLPRGLSALRAGVFKQQVGRGPTSPTGKVTLAGTWNGSPRSLPALPPTPDLTSGSGSWPAEGAMEAGCGWGLVSQLTWKGTVL